ncbi:MAG TPA: hypothetical protein VM364_09335 [Vicinamibacterales bacterium]|nr:hypothetical protein [Vicinamibacterales bacterium]
MKNRRALLLALVMTCGAVAFGAQERPERRVTIPALVAAIGFAPEEGMLIAWDPGGSSRWAIDAGRQRGRDPVIAKACGRVAVLPRSEDGRTIGANCRGKLYFYEVTTGRALGEWRLAEKQNAALYTAAADGRTAALVMAGVTGVVVVANLSSGAVSSEIPVGEEVEHLSLSADGARVAIGTARGVELRSLPGGALLRRIEGSAAHALSADGRRIAVVLDGGAGVFDVETGERVRELEGRVSHLRFGAGDRLLAGWTNQRLIVWDVERAAQRLVLTTEEFVAAAVSPDGSRLATVSLDRTGGTASSTLAVWRLP